MEKMTDKQKLFCHYYVVSLNATQAYKKAYDCGYETAKAEGYKHLAKPCLRKYIGKLKKEIKESLKVEAEDIVQLMIRIAFADINDYVEIKEGKAKIKDSAEFDGQIVQHIKPAKDGGVMIQLADKMSALKWLSEYFDVQGMTRARLEKMRTETEVLKKQTEGGKTTEASKSLLQLIEVLKEK